MSVIDTEDLIEQQEIEREEYPVNVLSVGEARTQAGLPADLPKVDEYVFVWSLRGSGTFILGGEEHPMHPRYVAFFPPEHEKLIVAGEHGWTGRWFVFSGALIKDICNALSLKPQPKIAGPFPFHYFESFQTYLSDPTPYGSRQASVEAYNFLTMLAGVRKRHPNEMSIYEACRQIMKTNFHDPALNINLLSEKLNVHRSTIFRIFKEETGLSPVEYLTRLRVQKGLILLKETSLPIATISREVGVADPNYFSRIIKKQTGMSPRTFRKK